MNMHDVIDVGILLAAILVSIFFDRRNFSRLEARLDALFDRLEAKFDALQAARGRM